MNDADEEQPIAFFGEAIKDYEDKYSYVENHVLVFIRALKKFEHLLSHNKVQLLVRHASVNDFHFKKDINEKRAIWITKVMDYDIDIKITNLVRSKGLCEKMISSQEITKEVALVLEEQLVGDENLNSWIHDMKTFLLGGGYPQELGKAKRR